MNNGTVCIRKKVMYRVGHRCVDGLLWLCFKRYISEIFRGGKYKLEAYFKNIFNNLRIII